MTSHADNHDRDKLDRWSKDLALEDPGRFPVCAVFLTSADDRASHEVFRRFRASFEERGAGFQHVVIFGQHGRSTTVNRVLEELGLASSSVPLAVLVPTVEPTSFYTLSLPAGGEAASGVAIPESEAPPDRTEADGPAWQEVLTGLEKAVDGGEGAPKLESIPGLSRHEFSAGSLAKLVNSLLSSL